AQAIVTGRERLLEAYHAHAVGELDVPAITTTCTAMGFSSWAQVDRSLAQADRRMAEVQGLLDRASARMRRVVPRSEREDGEDEELDPGAAQRRRVGLLDLLANAAACQGLEEREVLARLGRTRRELGPADEPALLALVQ
ncbi:MAG: hypothetical protein ACRCZP_13540, partial [Phycicoccus sp.]